MVSLGLLLAIGLLTNLQKKSSDRSIGIVLGAKAAGDPNHPEEVYVGSDKYRSLAAMVNSLNLTVYPEDKVKFFPDPELGLGSVITVKRAAFVVVKDGLDEIQTRTWTANVSSLLREKNVELTDKDIINPAASSRVTNNMVVVITRVSDGETKEIIKLPYKKTTKDDPNLERGKQRIEQKGVEGSKERIYLVRRENGKIVSKVLTSEMVIKEPQEEVIFKGIKIPLNLITKGRYKDIINAAAEKYGISASALYCLMMAESNGNINSVNPAGPYIGLFQYHEGTWNKYSSQAGYAGADIRDPEAQIYVTAWAIKAGKAASWGPWSSCKNK